MNSNQISLRSSNLQQLSASVTVPQYDRSALVPALVHIGAGSFNRSHLAVYLDDLLGRSGAECWAECGIGLLPPDLKIHSALASQDHLYSLLIRDAHTSALRIVGSIVEHIYAPDAPEQVIERMSSPECSILSLTVTEGGYFTDDGSGAFIEAHPEILFDVAHPKTPRTFLGYLAEAADRRRKRGVRPFTVMSCDNVQSNGSVARKALLSFAGMRDSGLQQWIERNVAFPNSMVDRITPATTDTDREFIGTHFGVSDLSPVVCEPFRQWVLEDTFSNKRPQWELADVRLTSDVKPFEMIKMRLLNGGHSAIAYLSALLGYSYVSQALEDAMVREILERFLEEVSCTLPDVAGMDLTEYKRSIVDRFSNPILHDQIPRICSEGSAKIAKFIIPAVRDLLSMSRTPAIIPFVIAAWLYSMRGIDEEGGAITIVDSSAGSFAGFVRSGSRDARSALAVRSVFGDLGAADNPFTTQVTRELERLHTSGVRQATRHLLSSGSAGPIE